MLRTRRLAKRELEAMKRYKKQIMAGQIVSYAREEKQKHSHSVLSITIVREITIVEFYQKRE